MKFNYLLFILSCFLLACQQNTQELKKQIYLEGDAQGTTYHIKYLDSLDRNFQVELDSILLKIDESMSTYLEFSLISQLNTQKDTLIVDDMFLKVLKKSFEISEKTNGAFDVTIAPIVNAWGWGFTNKAKIDSSLIDSLMQLVGKENFIINGNQIIKLKPNAMLDFNAIAQGYSVDVLAEFLELKNIKNYMVELGGEVRVSGLNAEDSLWRLGIDKPVENAERRELSAIISLDNQALATSGNYRKFYEENGVKYSHTINPKTAYPVRHSLLSASVIAKDAMTADAYATYFMVVGKEEAVKFLQMNQELEAYLIYADDKGNLQFFATNGIKQRIEEVND